MMIQRSQAPLDHEQEWVTGTMGHEHVLLTVTRAQFLIAAITAHAAQPAAGIRLSCTSFGARSTQAVPPSLYISGTH